MEIELFHKMAEVEDHHWWFGGRRAIVESVVADLNLSKDAEIFEAGCGTGGNLAMLARFGKVYGAELDDTARQYAIERGVGVIESCRLPESIPFGQRQFDLILLTDVLEHCDDDAGSLKALHERLKPGGSLLITVPAFPFLWSHHDELHHHKRRYVRANLSSLVTGAGFEIRFVSYYNTLLFPLIAGVRLGEKWFGNGNGNGSEKLGAPPAPFNDILRGLFASERHVVGNLSLPFGVSLILLARKAAQSAPAG